ncbi:hypothetical protein [Paenibacillus sp. CECT 9249]|nr:hypothetical protein [Paenibacillus sp. CECT 9249]
MRNPNIRIRHKRILSPQRSPMFVHVPRTVELATLGRFEQGIFS